MDVGSRGEGLVLTGVTGRKAPVWLLFCLDNFPLRVHSPGAWSRQNPLHCVAAPPRQPQGKKGLYPGPPQGLALAKCRCLEFLSA